MSLDDSVAFITEREQAARDELADEYRDRKERAEDAMISPEGYDALLEEMAGFNDDEKLRFMTFMALATLGSATAIYAMADRAKQRVIARRLAAGE